MKRTRDLKLTHAEGTLLQEIITETCESPGFADDTAALTRVYNTICAAPGKRLRRMALTTPEAHLLREAVEHVAERMRRTGDTTDLNPVHGKLGNFIYEAGADR